MKTTVTSPDVYEVKPVFLVHPVYNRVASPIVFTKPGNVDSSGYRPIAQMVESFKKAGAQLMAFRAAEFTGDLAINPLHASYVDPVDRDAALEDAIARGKSARDDFTKARRAALDRKAQEQDDLVMRLAEKIARRRDVVQRSSTGVPSNLSEESPPPSE